MHFVLLKSELKNTLQITTCNVLIFPIIIGIMICLKSHVKFTDTGRDPRLLTASRLLS